MCLLMYRALKLFKESYLKHAPKQMYPSHMHIYFVYIYIFAYGFSTPREKMDPGQYFELLMVLSFLRDSTLKLF